MSDKSARHYAEAVMQAMVERWQTTLNGAATAIKGDSKLAETMSGSDTLANKVKALIGALEVKPSTEEENLLKTLIQSGDIGSLAEIAVSLGEVATGQQGPSMAEVTSAIALTKKEQDGIAKKLFAEHGEGLLIDYSVDESLMGGLRIRVGDRLIDMSVASRLSAMRESLASAVR